MHIVLSVDTFYLRHLFQNLLQILFNSAHKLADWRAMGLYILEEGVGSG
jgi:hypothetical protein